jgi:hypothetical protein
MVTKPKSELIPTQTDALFDLEASGSALSFDRAKQPPLGVSRTFSHTGAPTGPGAFGGPSQKSGGAARVESDPNGAPSTRRHDGRPALFVSAFTRADEWEHEFLTGANLLGFVPTPQQWLIADALNAHDFQEVDDEDADVDLGLGDDVSIFGADDGNRPVNPTCGVCVPRRAGKTSALLAVALGRCVHRPLYSVLFTAQSGTKARDRFLDMARTLERLWPNEYERGFRVLKGAGHMAIEFVNGSFLQVVPPQQESFRGDAGDLIILDEAQEHDEAASADLEAGVLPVMDTRPGAQLVVAGTAGEHRSGLFWRTLEDGRAATGRTGIIEFAAPEGKVSAADLTTDGQKDWLKARDIIIAAHPGIGTTTTLGVVKERFSKLPLPQFMREYLGIWPEDFTRTAIDQKLWRGGALDEFVAKPAEFALAFDVNPNGSSAAIVAAWRADGYAYIELVAHEQGTEWLVPRLVALSKKYRVTIGHDTVGAALAESEALARVRPAPRRKPIGYKDVGAASASIMKMINGGELRHFDQAGLNDAAAKVVKRDLGENAWAWGRRQSVDVDITPIVAATTALRVYDTTTRRTGGVGMSSAQLRQRRAEEA